MSDKPNKSIISLVSCILVSIFIDLYLFWSGKSWTPLQYETFLSLALLGQVNYVLIKNILFFTLCNIAKVVFYEFGIGIEHAHGSDATFFIYIAVLILIFTSLKDAIRKKAITAAGILIIFGCAVIDKKLAEDRLFSSYLMQKTIYKHKPYKSSNTLYAEITDSVENSGAILIVWESLGWPKEINAINAFSQSVPGVQIQRVNFEGESTTAAENRYLCGSNLGVINYADCMPGKSYSEAYHGNTLSYFSRSATYSKMGFKKMYGRKELLDLPKCQYSYNAVCDDDLIDKLIQSVSKSQCKGLFYALTIDSHYPYKKYTSHIEGLLQDVALTIRKLTKVKKEFPNCKIIIIGDHPPPLSTKFDSKAVMRIDIY